MKFKTNYHEKSTTILIFLILCMYGNLHSQIDSTTIYNVATNLLAEMNETSLSFDSYDEFIYQGDTTLFIVHYNPNGFAIVSNSLYTYPVFAYSFDTNFLSDEIRDSLFLIPYSLYIISTDSSESKSSNSINIFWKKYTVDPNDFLSSGIKLNPVGPLLTTTWNQNYPYNNFCPEILGYHSL